MNEAPKIEALQVRYYAPEDFETILSWWKAHNFDMHPSMLPALGFVVEGICAVFLYQTDSAYCVLEWLVSNPEAEKNARRDAIDLVIAAAIEEATLRGYVLIHTMLKHPLLIDRYKKHGFTEQDTGMTSMLRGLR